jgi:transcription initiation factor TFIIE subunit alpha
MSDLTVYAEKLIATVARAFYDDDVVCLVDVLIRDKYLRDDDMAPRLQIPVKDLRKTLQFLEEEHMVGSETVDDLNQGGSQSSKFYYLDYCRAVHSIRLRLHLLKKKLQEDELKARSSSFYLCPGYKMKRCNGQYTEEEAQQVVDAQTGLFLCHECFRMYENDPGAPSIDTYTLKLVDNRTALREAVDNLRRLNVQLSAKFIGNTQLRSGIYDLLQKVRGSGKSPITSNLPSENFALGIGSKRLAGTGRTAGIKAKKLEQQGVATSAAQAKNYLVGSAGSKQSGDEDLMFLKNAMGHEIQFTVERGGGIRAQLLATKKQRTRKLLDAAASRVGVSLPLYTVLQETSRIRKKKEKEEEKDGVPKKKQKVAIQTLEFLRDNIGRYDEDLAHEELREAEREEQREDMFAVEVDEELVLCDETAELKQLEDEERLIAFQEQYKMEVMRQEELFKLKYPGSCIEEELSIAWEEGGF